MDKKTIGLLLVVFALAITACTVTYVPSGGSGGSIEFQGNDEVKKFSSRQEIIDYLSLLEDYQGESYYGSLGRSNIALETFAMDAEESAAVPTAVGGASKSDGETAAQHSTTNVQVEGVDEADFVKNDGKYIYVLSGSNLVIVDAYPAEDAEILSETEIEGNPVELFVNDDVLVVFAQGNDYVYTFEEYNFMPRPLYKQKTHAYIYDISNREKPKLEKDYDLKGNYYDARMIGDYVYLIVQDYVYHYRRFVDVPVVMESSKTVISPEIYYFDNPESSYNFNTIMSISLKDLDEVQAKSFMMGYSDTLYVSENNIYMAYRKNMPYRYYDDYNEERFYSVVVPLLPSSVRSEINSIKNDGSLDSYEKWDRIASVLEDMYNNMDEDDQDELLDEIEEAISEYEIKQEMERRKTVIHKIAIDKGSLEYKDKGEVQGYLLNQFSMDEHGEYFRVATTMQAWTRGESILYNNVYVLDEDMDVVGELEDIAPDESIYSTRFIGDRLYMVTFKRIDPFFVIDLSDPEDPEILGKLKIPGYSDYLHPYDENHIIGIGKEAKENEWGGVTTEGVKLALFDVSDVENPKQVAKYEIGDSGSDSEALRDHKAFLFDKEKNLLVLPVRAVKNRYKDARYGYYRYRTWQGAYVFSLTPEDGFEVQGKITHAEKDDDDLYYSYYGENAVRRSLHMDDVLYTISMGKIKMTGLDDMEEVNEIELPYESYVHKYYPEVRGIEVMEDSDAEIIVG
ncbi:beta-propeller domain-containing protein [Candidatus Woesearchaeota archaeon]|nr:beta-propeller domain-containing protein [Candidatus Woesearchaeota archaeon]